MAAETFEARYDNVYGRVLAMLRLDFMVVEPSRFDDIAESMSAMHTPEVKQLIAKGEFDKLPKLLRVYSKMAKESLGERLVAEDDPLLQFLQNWESGNQAEIEVAE